MSKENKFKLFIKSMRPKQWTKNILVFAALIFSIHEINIKLIANSFIGFVCFCIVSSCVYILNDFADIEKDKNHPEKKNRPMASGKLNPIKTLTISFVLLITAMLVAYSLSKIFLAILIAYYIMNVAYSFYLKNIVILDVMIIAIGFILRALAGAYVIDVPYTEWLLLCTLFLSLFLAISKRRHEITMLKHSKGQHRKVLEKYSEKLLDQMNSMVITSTVICYSLFTFNSGHSRYLMLTIPLVLYGIFRYLYLIHIENKGGSPDKLLYEDKHILYTVTLYGISVLFIMLLVEK